MRAWAILLAIISLYFFALPAVAEIYSWIDENGVKHFSTTPPPNGVEAFNKTEEIPHDEATDRQRDQMEKQKSRQRHLEERRLEAERQKDREKERQKAEIKRQQEGAKKENEQSPKKSGKTAAKRKRIIGY